MQHKHNGLNVIMIVLLAGLLCSVPCQSQTDGPKDSASDVALKTVLKRYLKEQNVENDGTVRYVPAFVDLNEDGMKEVIVYVMCQSLCGTGGCPTLVLVPMRSSFRIVSRITITRPPIRVLEKKSRGWHDLTVWVQGGGIQPGYEADLPFDGGSYATNPTVSPAHRLSPKTAGRVVISDRAIGTPLD